MQSGREIKFGTDGWRAVIADNYTFKNLKILSQAVADYLKGAPGDALLVEGHCDERGTEEYNRALGERRALALREALISGGADGQKIVTRSYGKDRKVDTGNSDAAHAKNRRGEFILLDPPK